MTRGTRIFRCSRNLRCCGGGRQLSCGHCLSGGSGCGACESLIQILVSRFIADGLLWVVALIAEEVPMNAWGAMVLEGDSIGTDKVLFTLLRVGNKVNTVVAVTTQGPHFLWWNL